VTTHWQRGRADFLAGLAVVLPAIISILILRWLFVTTSTVTDTLLFFLPRTLTHAREGDGPVYWYWSLLALVLAIALIAAIGRAARNYAGRKLIEAIDRLVARVPLLNKIYGTIKQVNEAFSSTKKSSFKQVVLVEYPRPGVYSMGFLTSDTMPEPEARVGRPLDGVFIPTTPNPTSGFLIMVPDEQVIRLQISVADGIKYIISLGTLVPEHQAETARQSGVLPPATP
jgi:uncharacterized membrane protein